MRNRGMTLGSVLMLVGLLASLGMALAGGAVSHHHLLQNSSLRHSCRNLARSVIQLTFEKLLRDPSLGKAGNAVEEVNLTLEGEYTGGQALLVFDRQRAGELGLAASLNNLEEPQSTLDSRGQSVPSNAVRLIGVGRCRGVEQVVEATLVVPAFPWALASGGDMRAEDGLEIGAVQTIPSSLGELGSILPADAAANGNIYLGPHSVIEGDVQAAGRVDLSPQKADTIQVKGQIRPGAQPVRIPELDLSQFDPVVRSLHFTALTEGDISSPDSIRGAYRREGSLHVQGDLKLSGGLLFVHGDLQVTGGIVGRGLVVSTGKITVAGSSQLEGSNSVAVLSGGDMSLRGRGKDRSSVAGLVYSKGNFEAESVSVLGTLVALQKANFRDARMLSVDGSAEVNVSLSSGGPENRVDIPLSALGGGTFLAPDEAAGVPGTPLEVAPQSQPSLPFVLSMVRLQGPPDNLSLSLYQKAGVTYSQVGSTQVIANTPEARAAYCAAMPGGYSMDADHVRVAIPAKAGPDVVEAPVPGQLSRPQASLQVDLSSVLKLEDRIRLCQWKET